VLWAYTYYDPSSVASCRGIVGHFTTILPDARSDYQDMRVVYLTKYMYIKLRGGFGGGRRVGGGGWVGV
jgi:hypothetical protein